MFEVILAAMQNLNLDFYYFFHAWNWNQNNLLDFMFDINKLKYEQNKIIPRAVKELSQIT